MATDHVTVETLAAIERIPDRFLRTSRHPSASLVARPTTFDDLYDSADTFDDVYVEITDRLIAAAHDHGEILYAVPGSPLVLERTVRYLRERCADAATGIELEILPAMSFLDVAYARLGIDPVEAGVRLVDGHDFATAAAGERGPLLVAHTHANWVLSDIKLAVDGAAGDEPVVILQALGTPDERIVDTTWAELDRTVEADHLTSIWIPELATPVGAEYVRFHQLARTLREQCPWDIEQTHQSLIPYLLEETYEVVDALQALDPDDPTTDDDLIEELGDLLYQIEFHATIAEQEGRFTIADVAAGVHDKLVRRHPHVFGRDGEIVDVGAGADAVDRVLANWDDIKRDEKQRTSIFDGIPRSMPSLGVRGHGRPEGVEGRLRLARRRRRVPEDRRGDAGAARGDRRRATRRATRRTRRPALRRRQRRPPPRHRSGTRAARRDRQVPFPVRDGRAIGHRPGDRSAHERPRHPRRPVGRSQERLSCCVG